jgi:hypothetical protein
MAEATTGGAEATVDAEASLTEEGTVSELEVVTPRTRIMKKSPRPTQTTGRKKKKGTAQKKRKKREKVVALYDVGAPAGSGRISVAAGEVLLLVQKTNKNWYRVKSHTGVIGYIPAAYVTAHISGISSLEPPPQPDMPEEDFTVDLGQEAGPEAATVEVATPGTLSKLEDESLASILDMENAEAVKEDPVLKEDDLLLQTLLARFILLPLILFF